LFSGTPRFDALRTNQFGEEKTKFSTQVLRFEYNLSFQFFKSTVDSDQVWKMLFIKVPLDSFSIFFFFLFNLLYQHSIQKFPSIDIKLLGATATEKGWKFIFQEKLTGNFRGNEDEKREKSRKFTFQVQPSLPHIHQRKSFNEKQEF
jgi:hypothetical protein